MDPRLLRFYNRELQHIREVGGEFAAQFPKIAGRLGLDSFECADPYVERLLEGFAFMAARVQLKIAAEFPQFTQHLFETLFPHYLAPIPSMTVVQFQPDLAESSLADGYRLSRDTVLRSVLGKDDLTSCEYRTAHDLTLWPVEIVEAKYYTREMGSLGVPNPQGAKAALRLRLRTAPGLTFNKTKMNELLLYLRGADETPMHIYEQLFANALSVVVRPTEKPVPWHEVIPKTNIRRVGFDQNQALLPYGPASFQGYRILQEYFTFPQRFMFVELEGLGKAFRRCEGNELDIIVLLDRADLYLESAMEPANFALHCTPAINLFPKRADRIHISDRSWEFHVVPDRTRPLDLEVYSVKSVTGFGSGTEDEQPFNSFYSSTDAIADEQGGAYYSVSRTPRMKSDRERRSGRRSSYIGSEVYISLVDSRSAPYHSDLRQLAIETMCTNRDLPLSMPVGQGNTDFNNEAGGPIKSVRCVSGPTAPRPSFVEGEVAWRLISHLSLNYMSLVDNDPVHGPTSLRDLLKLYGDTSEAHIAKQIEGVKSVSSKSLMRRVATSGPITFARGLEIALTFDEAAFEGTGVFLLGAVLEQFTAKYVSMNSFTETVIKTVDRGEIMRWPARIGTRRLL